MSIVDISDENSLTNEYNRVFDLFNQLRNDLINLNPNSPEANLLRERVLQLENELIEIRKIYLEKKEPIKEVEYDSEEQKGDGFFIRDPTINPPAVRKILESIGNEKVQTLTLVRTPLSKTTKFLLNLVSLGKLQKATEQIGVDDFFHLSMIINNKYTLEKNEVIRLYKENRIPQGSITLNVPVQIDTTINEMLDFTKQYMGNNYGTYDAKTNNCGIFLDSVLKANGMSNNETDKFLNQPTIELFNSFPKFSEIITKLGTTAGAVSDRLLQGEGEKKPISSSTMMDESAIEKYQEELDMILDEIENNDTEVERLTYLVSNNLVGNDIDVFDEMIDTINTIRDRQLFLFGLRDNIEKKIDDIRKRGSGSGREKPYIHNFGLHNSKILF